MERVYYATSRQKAYKIADRLIKQQRDKYGVICEMQYLWRIEERLWKLILRQV
jgi:hypothetical protein